MHIIQVNLANKKQVRDFLDLPFRIYRDTPQWVPPLDSDAKLYLTPSRHPFYKHSEAAFFLAYRDSLPTGRLAVLDNRPYNDYNHTRTAFFYLFECENNPEAASRLFEAACAWARAHWSCEVLWLAGFSFGAAVALEAAAVAKPSALVTVAPPVGRIIVAPVARPSCPWLVVQGDRDELVDVATVRRWVAEFALPPRLLELPGAEHFFHGRLGELRGAVHEFLSAGGGAGV